MQEKSLRQVDLLEMVKPFCQKYNVKINKSDISQYLSGKVKPGQEKLSMLSMALGVTESWLMGYDSLKEKTHYIEALVLTPEETTLLENYKKLNNLGKKEANKRVSELAEIPKYNNEPKTLQDLKPTLLAAHDDDLTEEEKEEIDKRILKVIKTMKK